MAAEEEVAPPARSRSDAVLDALRALDYGPYGPGAEGLVLPLNALAASPELRAAGPRWWSGFDERARMAHWPLPGSVGPDPAAPAWRRLLRTRPRVQRPDALLPFWDWALAVCAANGRTRQAALAPDLLPLGTPVLIPLLVIRSADWAEPVREAARTALAGVLERAGTDELVQAAVTAWDCERRRHGEPAVGIVAARLAGADVDPGVWRSLHAYPDHRIRRRALAQAIDLGRWDQGELLALAVSDPDVLVARHAAEHLLNILVPAGIERPVGSEAEPALRTLLGSRVPAVRAVAVTVLRRGRRPDLAAPFTVDSAGQVREVARWVLRSHGQDPAPVCRDLLAGPAEQITPGTVSGTAECGDRADADLLRAQLTHRRPKVRAAALYALGTMRPAAVTTSELQDLMDRDPSAGVLRTAAALLEPDAAAVPRRRLDAWLATDRPARLRAQAARLLRARGSWDRVETDLRLLHDTDAELAGAARSDLRVWADFSAATYRRLGDGQRETILTLLGGAADAVDARVLDRIRFALARAVT